MKYCFITDTPIELRPHLMRLISWLVSDGNCVDVYSIGGAGQPALIGPKKTDSKQPVMHVLNNVVQGKTGVIKNIIRLNKLIRENILSWDYVFICHPYMLLTPLSLFQKRSKVIYYSAELWDGVRLLHLSTIERIRIRKIDGIVVPLAGRAAFLQKQYGSTSIPSFVLPNSSFDYYDRYNTNSTKSNDKSGIVFVYQGTSNIKRRHLDTVIELFGNMNEPVKLIMALGGEKYFIDKIKEFAKAQKYHANIEFVEFEQYPDHFKMTIGCDVGIMLYNENISVNYRLCAPNKIYEYAMLGLPVIASRQKHLKDIIETNHFGICVDPSESESLESAVRQLLDKKKIKTMGANARSWYLSQGNYSIHGQQLKNWLDLEFGVQ